MRDVRESLLETKAVKSAYGCAAHLLNKISKEICKKVGFEKVIKDSVHVENRFETMECYDIYFIHFV